MRRPSPIARAAYELVTLMILAAGLHQMVMWLAAGSAAIGIGQLP